MSINDICRGVDDWSHDTVTATIIYDYRVYKNQPYSAGLRISTEMSFAS